MKFLLFCIILLSSFINVNAEDFDFIKFNNFNKPDVRKELNIPDSSRYVFRSGIFERFSGICINSYVFNKINDVFFRISRMGYSTIVYNLQKKGLTTVAFHGFENPHSLYESYIEREIFNPLSSMPYGGQFMSMARKYYWTADSMRMIGDWCSISRPDGKKIFFGRGNLGVWIEAPYPVIDLAQAIDGILCDSVIPKQATAEEFQRLDSMIAADEQRKKEAEAAAAQKHKEEFAAMRIRTAQEKEQKDIREGVLPNQVVRMLKETRKDAVKLRKLLKIASADKTRLTPNSNRTLLTYPKMYKKFPRVIPQTLRINYPNGFKLDRLQFRFADTSVFPGFGPKYNIQVVHAASREEAVWVLLGLRLTYRDKSEENISPEVLFKTTAVNAFPLGDYNLSWKGTLGADLLPDGKSDESLLFFLRGNSAVVIQSIDRFESALDHAQIMDRMMTHP